MTTPFAATRTPPPPLRENPTAPDREDGARIAHIMGPKWRQQNGSLLNWQRSVEKNIRMLSGQQWSRYNSMLNRWVDLREFLTDDERRWRQRPVVNLLLQWFMLTHARLTENPPIIGFLPGPDRKDADLAATMDLLFKYLWRDMGMPDAIDRLYGWLIPCGSAYLQTRVDPNAGPEEKWEGAADVPLYGPDGQPVMSEQGAPQTQFVEQGVPFGPDGSPLARIGPEGLQMMGEPHKAKRGGLVIDVLSPLEVRGQWGPTPWHQKLWHTSRHFLAPEEAYERFGVDVEPTIQPGGVLDDRGTMERVLFGAGWFGATDSAPGSFGNIRPSAQLLCDVYCYWERPTAAFPQGRYTVVTPKDVLYDGPRPAEFRYTSPLRRFEFVRIPGRPNGTTPQEAMNGPQEAFNRGMAQQLEHRNLVSNPKSVVDMGSGLGTVKITNRPGENLKVNRRPGVPPFEWVAPPPLGSDVYVIQKELVQLIQTLGWTEGGQGQPPGEDPSGELVKELRFNADRFAGPTQRRAVEEIGRLAEDWMTILPVIWTAETVLDVAGEDNVARTIVVAPMMFDPVHVHVTPDAESMLPEGRGERQARVWAMYREGLFGDPMGPESKEKFFELAQFPHLSRAGKPGGIDRTTADHENGKLLQGVPWKDIPVFDWYDDAVHLMVHEKFMKSPDFLLQPPEVQQNFAIHRDLHRQAMQVKAVQQALMQGQLQMQMAGAAGLMADGKTPLGGAPGPSGGKPTGRKLPETEKPAGSATPAQPASVG